MTDVLDNKLDFKPQFALTFYSNNTDVYIEKSFIKNNKITTTEPLKKEALNDFVKKLNIISEKDNSIAFNNYIPNLNHLFFNGLNLELGWVCRGYFRPYRTRKKKYELWYPHIYFKLAGDVLYLYALKTTVINKRTIFYKLPLPNIYSDNKMCFGNMNIKHFLFADISKTMQSLENAFFNSYFNNFLRENSYGKNINIELEKCFNKPRQIDTKYFIKTKK